MVALIGGKDADILRAANASDSIVGNGSGDTLTGLGRADVIDGGEGNDNIHGDGTYTLFDAVKEMGKASIAFDGTVSHNSGLLLTSMGRMSEWDGDSVTVWRIRNASGSDQTVVLRASSGHSTQTFTVGAHSDLYVTSADLSTHQLMLGRNAVSVKAPNTTDFTSSLAYGEQLDGDDTLTGGAGDDNILGGGGNDTIDGGLGNDAIDGGDGNDTISGGDDNDAIAGGDGNDVVDGGAGNDKLSGGAGNDILNGGAGADVLDGGNNYDHADYRTATSGVTVNLVTGLGSGGEAEGDIYISIENAHLSAYDDTITTGDGVNELSGRGGNDTLNGGGGGDVLNGGAGSDVLNGGDGSDWASYVGSGSGVSVNLATGGFGGRAGGDSYISIENVLGSDHDDTIIGDGAANRLDGGKGNDLIQGAGGNDQLVGGEGADKLDGGAGVDTANYEFATAAVALDLALGGTGGDAAGDSFLSIEFVLGSDFGDAISGDGLDNRLNGGKGDDMLQGGNGKDALIGGAGNDVATGGAGYDVFWFRDADQGSDTVTDFAAGAGMTDRIWLGGSSGVADWAGVLGAAADSAEGVLLTLANGSLLIAGVSTAMLNADDFLF